MNHPNDKSEVIDEWCDLHSSTALYASRFAGDLGKWMLEVQEESLFELLKLPYGSKVLDVGGGHAQLTSALLQRGFDVTIHGSCKEAMGLATSFIQDGRCSWSDGPLNNLPHGNQSFDAVIAFRMVAHIEDWQKFILELCRVAKGSVIIDYPTIKSFNFLSTIFFPLKKKIENNTRKFTIFRDSEIHEIFKSVDFNNIKRSKQFLLPMAFYRALVSIGNIFNVKSSKNIEIFFKKLGLTSSFGSPVVLMASSIDEIDVKKMVSSKI